MASYFPYRFPRLQGALFCSARWVLLSTVIAHMKTASVMNAKALRKASYIVVR